MKILIIDYLSYKAHQNFNKIHFDALVKMGHSLHLVGREGQFDNMKECNKVIISRLPEFFFRKFSFSFASLVYRIIYVMCLLWVRTHFRFNNYDAIIVPTYDPMSIFALRTCKKTILITHDAHYLDNRVKLFFLKQTPKHYIHIGLSEEMTFHIQELLPNRKVFHVPHGLCQPPVQMKKPDFIKKGEKFLFCPVNSLYNKEFVNGMLNDDILNNYLKNNNIKIYVKKQLVMNNNSDNIIRIDNMLTKEEYDYMIKYSKAVIIPYYKEYKYRCSGIMFECVACDTPVLATRLSAWTYLEKIINIQMFENTQQLINGIDYYEKKGVAHVDKSYFNPISYWSSVFEKMYSPK